MPNLNNLTDIARFASTLPPDLGAAVNDKVLDLIQHLQAFDFSGRLDKAGFSPNSHARLYRRLKSAAQGEMQRRSKRRKAKADENAG